MLPSVAEKQETSEANRSRVLSSLTPTSRHLIVPSKIDSCIEYSRISDAVTTRTARIRRRKSNDSDLNPSKRRPTASLLFLIGSHKRVVISVGKATGASSTHSGIISPPSWVESKRIWNSPDQISGRFVKPKTLLNPIPFRPVDSSVPFFVLWPTEHKARMSAAENPYRSLLLTSNPSGRVSIRSSGHTPDSYAKSSAFCNSSKKAATSGCVNVLRNDSHCRLHDVQETIHHRSALRTLGKVETAHLSNFVD